jgi:cobalt-zinc-cadmium efflux system outer membrane protein
MYLRAKDESGRCLRNSRRSFLNSQSFRWPILLYFSTIVLVCVSQSAAQQSSVLPSQAINIAVKPGDRTQSQAAPSKRLITLAQALDIFMQRNLQLVAARYDIDSAEADKITAKLRPNPQVAVGFSGAPLNLSGPLITEQTYDYAISQTFELGGKRSKRIDVADRNIGVSHGQFEETVWMLTNDLKRKFYTVLLNQSLLKLAQENQTTFDEIVKATSELVQTGEVSGLDLKRLEVEKLKFDTDVANADRDYEVALRDLRFALGGDYRTMDFDVAGDLDYQPYDFSLSDLRDKSLAARPDLKVARLAESAADASIRLQSAQRIPDLNLGGGMEQVPAGTNTYLFSVGIELPVHNRNQGERAKALIEKQKAQNQAQLVTNQILSDVDKALVAFERQKHRVELYRTGVLTKADDIQKLTEFALKAGESSILELLDAIRTRRDTLASYYQTLFDYQMSVLDLELATATPLQK